MIFLIFFYLFAFFAFFPKKWDIELTEVHLNFEMFSQKVVNAGNKLNAPVGLVIKGPAHIA